VKIVPKQLGEIAFISSYFSHKSLIKLQLTLRQMPNLYWGMIELPDTAVNKQLRGQLKLNIANNEFEKILETLIPAQIPIAYIEAFRDLQARAGGYYRNGVKVIYTANAYSGDEGFKIWCAEKVEKGAKFAIGQHGGNMGTSLIQQSEDHQIAVSDRFYSWGWINRDEKIIKPMPAGKLIDLRKNVRSDPNGPILWVTASLPRYSYCLYSVPIGPQYLNYMKSQIAFAKRTSKPAFELLQIRLDNSDFGWDFEARLKDNGLERKIQRNCDDFIGSLKKSRLCIATHNSTSFLETLAANYPTLIFWDPRYYELRPKAQKYFDGLRQVGILHDTPESAAATLNEIYLDPLSWWRQSARQAVKDQFCDQFAYIGDNWIQQWRKELMSL
jgi:putative transferase (TIGR04331 family)